MGQTRSLASPEDLAKAEDDIGTTFGIAESRALVDGQFGHEGSDVRLAVAVSHAGEFGEGTEPDSQDTRIALIGPAGAIHGIVDRLLGEGVSILYGGCFPNADAAAGEGIECAKFRSIWIRRIFINCSKLRCS